MPRKGAHAGLRRDRGGSSPSQIVAVVRHERFTLGGDDPTRPTPRAVRRLVHRGLADLRRPGGGHDEAELGTTPILEDDSQPIQNVPNGETPDEGSAP